jgi:hypothetical protein
MFEAESPAGATRHVGIALTDQAKTRLVQGMVTVDVELSRAHAEKLRDALTEVLGG